MSSPIHLSLSCGEYDINRGLLDGTVKPQGIDLTVLAYPTPPRQWRMDRHTEFDVCEFSMSSWLVACDRQLRNQPLAMEPVAAIPVFPHRRFRHSFVFVNPAAGIKSPKDLEGRRVGLRTWQATAGLWGRGILQDEYGVDLKKVIWLTSDDEAIPELEPVGFDIHRVPAGSSITRMLLDGELDALIYPEIPAAFAAGDPRIQRLFPDYKQQEMAYFKRTGFFPIMHTVVIRRSIYEAEPWVARAMVDAFVEAKRVGAARLAADGTPYAGLPWLTAHLEELARVMGPDPYPYGFLANHATVTAFLEMHHAQGLAPRLLTAEELFVPETHAS